MLICNLKTLLSSPDAYLPKEDVSGYTLMAVFDGDNTLYRQVVQLFEWLDIKSDKPISKCVKVTDENGNDSNLEGLYYCNEVPVSILATINSITEIISALDLTKLSSDISDVRVGDVVFMSGMYATIIDRLIDIHKADKLKFIKKTGIEGLANVTLLMQVTDVSDTDITFGITPYLVPLLSFSEMKFTKDNIASLRPYIQIVRMS